MDAIQAVLDHPYAWLGPLVMLEGPAVTVTAGSLVGAGLALFWPVWLIVVLAELAGDSLLYLAGRSARRPWVAALLTRLRMTPSLDRLGTTSLPALVLTAKSLDVAAVPLFLAAGFARIPYRRFAAWVTAATAVRAVLLVGLGALLGHRLTDLLRLPGGIFLLTAAVAVPVAVLHLAVRHWKGRSCAFSSAPTPTLRTSTARPPSPSASPPR